MYPIVIYDYDVSVEKIIEAVCAKVRTRYVFPDRAAQAAAMIEVSLAAGEYVGLGEVALAERLTEQLYAVCEDRHLAVRIRSGSQGDTPEPEALERALQEKFRACNFGIAKVERLDGNVGYLDLRLIADPGSGGQAIAAAMELVSQTYALIIDVRRNRGGWPDGAIFWCSYLFPDDQTHLNDIFDPESGLTRQYWTLAYLPGRRYVDRPVYVLTSGLTFSGGEDLCYNLQAQGRAQLIGETTRGGAHPFERFVISPTIEITVPSTRSVNPVTGTNWEGTGVVPDIAVPAAEAFDLAYRRALQHVLTMPAPASITDEATAVLASLQATARPDSARG
jgi:hypothetical protein